MSRIVICIVLCINLLLPHNSLLENTREEDMLFEYMDIIERQEPAVSAYRILQEEAFIIKNGNFIYPDDFAGAWIEDDVLIIALNSRASFESYESIFIGHYPVEFRIADYSYNQLMHIISEVDPFIEEKMDVCSYYVDMINNCICYEITDDLDYASRSLKGIINDIPGLNEDLEPVIRFYNATHVISEVSLIGGDEISAYSVGSSTLGLCGTFTYNGTSYSGFVTAGHAADSTVSANASTSVMKYQGNPFGYCRVKSYSNGANGDYALVSTAASYTLTNKVYGTSTAYQRSIIGYNYDLAPGTFVMKFGKASGYAAGYVLTNNCSINATTSITIHGLTRCSIYSGSSAKGDSGGPYYSGSTSGYYFAGVHHGANDYMGEHVIYFTPYLRFSSYFTPKTS